MSDTFEVTAEDFLALQKHADYQTVMRGLTFTPGQAVAIHRDPRVVLRTLPDEARKRTEWALMVSLHLTHRFPPEWGLAKHISAGDAAFELRADGSVWCRRG